MTRHKIAVFAVYVGLIAAGWYLGQQVRSFATLEADAGDGMLMGAMIFTVSAVYMLASALPFVPGAEIGLGLMSAFGAKIALVVYLCMVGALLLAFWVGRLMPQSVLAQVFRTMRLHRAAALVEQVQGLSRPEREAYLTQKTTNRMLLVLLGNRYLALALALNIPGNTLLGGGGGLALFAGTSRLFSPTGFCITVMIAVAPVPLTVYLLGF